MMVTTTMMIIRLTNTCVPEKCKAPNYLHCDFHQFAGQVISLHLTKSRTTRS